MKEENKLFCKVGTKNPFKVPDGYFSDFTQELMDKLPEKENLYASQEITLWERVKPWLYMTAMFCGIMLSVRIFVGPSKETNSLQLVELENMSDEDWTNLSTPSLVDDYSLYQFLTDAEEYYD